MSRAKVTLTAGFAVLALGGALMASAPAQAGASTGTWRNGAVATPYGVAQPRYGYGYRSAGYGYRPYYRRHRSNVGGAVAAGVVGGLALGALAASPAYSYPAYPARSGYYGASYYDAPSCYMVRRRVVDDWGRVFIRRTQVCE